MPMYALYILLYYLFGDRIPKIPEINITASIEKEYHQWSTNRYKVFGITNDGAVCIDNCNVTCRTGWDENEKKACTIISNVTAPVYFTSRYRTPMSVCLTRCGKYGYDYEWCVTSYKGSTNWDYCSSEIYKPEQKTYKVESDGTFCFSECKLTNEYSLKTEHILEDFCEVGLQSHTQYVCTDAWNVSRKCNPKISYIPARTTHGDVCIDSCSLTFVREGRIYMYVYKCQDRNMNWEYCAPSARIFTSHTREELFYRTSYVYRPQMMDFLYFG